MFTIQKVFSFEAAHYLRDYDGDCGRTHGHSYKVELVLRCKDNELIGPGFVREFRDLDRFKAVLDMMFDHQLLNDVPPFDEINPTTEHLAQHFYEVAKAMFPELVKVRVSETAKTWVEYEEGETP